MRNWTPCPVRRPVSVTALYSAFESENGPHFAFPGESHNFWEAVCVVSGTAGILANSSVYTLQPGSLALHRPMEFHRVWSANNAPSAIAVVSFDAEFLREPSERLYNLIPADTMRFLQAVRSIREAFRMNEREVIAPVPGKESAVQKAVSDLENLLLSVTRSATPSSATENATQAARHYAAIIDCIGKHLNQNLVTADIAAKCGLSASTVKQVFRKFAGISLMEYVRDLKIKTAQSLLLRGDSVKNVANELGFRDPNYFSTVFRRTTGHSPREFAPGRSGASRAPGPADGGAG